MAASADAMIHNALTRGAVGFPAPHAGEVSAAYAVVVAGASQLAAAWSPLLTPLKIQVRSWAAFVHASPKVTFDDPVTGRPEERELADLLIVIDYRLAGKVVDRRAELIQAKVAKPRGGIRLDKGARAQRNLYLHWPPFTMPAGYQVGERDLHDPASPGSPADGCRFGGISLGPTPGWFQIATAMRMSILNAPELGSWITRMALGAAGRQATEGGADPWSELVDELLRSTLARSFPKGSGSDRLVDTVSLTLPSDNPIELMRTITRFSASRSPAEGPPAGDPERRGISTIKIELDVLDGPHPT